VDIYRAVATLPDLGSRQEAVAAHLLPWRSIRRHVAIPVRAGHAILRHISEIDAPAAPP